MRVVVHGAAPLGGISVALEDSSGTALAAATGSSDSDRLELQLPLEAPIGEEVECTLVARSADGGTSVARVITEAKLQLLMALETQLLFAGCEGAETADTSGAHQGGLDRVVALVEASLLQKLQTDGGLDCACATVKPPFMEGLPLGSVRSASCPECRAGGLRHRAVQVRNPIEAAARPPH